MIILIIITRIKFIAILISFLLLFFPKLSYAEASEITLQQLKKNQILIENAAHKFTVNPLYLSAIIYVERILNYNQVDDSLDITLAKIGYNSSIGFAQVKLKTAYFIERQLHKPTSLFYPGGIYENFLQVSRNPSDLIEKLRDDASNILYASAYLRLMQSRWEKAGFPIDQRPDILGTLYSTGLFNDDGTERQPHMNPKPNRFGKIVMEVLKTGIVK